MFHIGVSLADLFKIFLDCGELLGGLPIKIWVICLRGVPGL